MSWFKNAIAKLYAAVSAPVATTRDAFLKRLGDIRSTVETAIEIVKLCREWVAMDPSEAVECAARYGCIEIVKLCKEWGATDFDEAMCQAACGGHVEIVELCKEWGAADFDEAMRQAAEGGHIGIVELCKEWGATDFEEAMWQAASEGHIDLVKLCRGWLGYDSIHHDLLRHHHKREFFGRIRDELLSVAWHPDRFFDWCVDEEEKGFLKKMWKIWVCRQQTRKINVDWARKNVQ